MSDLVDVVSMRYAVLGALGTEGDSERFVVAYRNEHSLRDLIAAPCIAAFGFSSREQAAARTEARLSMDTIHKTIEGHQHGTHWTERRSETASASRIIRRLLVAFYCDAVAAVILVFSSRNVISVVIRTFLAV